MLVKTIYREAKLYGVCVDNPSTGLRTPKIQIADKKFLTWEEVDAIDWGRYNEQDEDRVARLALHTVLILIKKVSYTSYFIQIGKCTKLVSRIPRTIA